MLIKSLTLHQPWASFMALGLKRNETRSWKANYHGPLAIHAALRKPKIGDHIPCFDLAIQTIGQPMNWQYGKILCVVDLEGWLYIPDKLEQKEIVEMLTYPESILGDYSLGRYVWQTKMIQVFDEPIPAKGKQGLWDWEWEQ